MSRHHSDRKRRFSDIQEGTYTEKYVGPEEFLEAGVRGFLVTTLPDKEEFAIDDAIDLLRQAAIKLSGGMKAGKNTVIESGYTKIDFMDPKEVTIIPNPDGEEEEEEAEEEDKKDEEEKKTEEEQKVESGEENETKMSFRGATFSGIPGILDSDVKDAEETKEEAVGGEESKEEEKMEESKEEEKMEELVEESKDDNKDNDKEPKEGGEEKGEEDGKEEKEGEEKEEKDDAEKEKEKGEKDAEKGEKKDKDSEKKKGNEKSSGRRDEKKNRDKKKQDRKPKFTYMKSSYKFKAFRTEIRNLMFIKSDYPNPMELAATAMEIIVQRKSITGDAVSQLMPVLGTCDFDMFQLEVMSRRVLSPLFDESLDSKTVSIMLFDKMSEPGSLMLMEVVRNTIWSVNPLTCSASPLTEPDYTIRLEVIGSKLILCCMPDFIKYRQYSPAILVALGTGEAEDDDFTHISSSQRKSWEERCERKRKAEEERKVREEAKRIRKEQEEKERQERKEKKEKERQERKEKQEKERKEKEAAKKAEEAKKAKEKKENEEAEKSSEVKEAAAENSEEAAEEPEMETSEQAVEEPKMETLDSAAKEPEMETPEPEPKIETSDEPKETSENMDVDEKPASRRRSTKSTEEQPEEAVEAPAEAEEVKKTTPRGRKSRKTKK